MKQHKIVVFKSRESRRFIYYLAQYLSLVLLILALTIPLYTVAVDTNRQNEINSATSMFKMAFSEVNSMIDSLVTESDRLFEDKDVILLTSNKSKLTSQDYMRMRDATTLLSRAIRGKSMLSDIYIINNSNTVLISNKMVSDNYNKVYGYFYLMEGVDVKQWLDKVRSGTSKQHFIESVSCKPFASADSPNRLDAIHFVVRSTALTENQNTAYAVYILNTNVIVNRFVSDYLRDYAYLSIKDTAGNQLLSYGRDETINLDDYEKIESSSVNLNVTLGIKKTYFQDRVANIRNVLLLYSLVLVGVAFLLAILLTFRQLKPLRYLMDSLRNLGPEDPAAYIGTDYQYISDTVIHIDTQRRQYEQEISTMQNSIRNNLVNSIFHGGVYTQEDADLCRQVLNLDGKVFCVVLMFLQEAMSISEAGKMNTICSRQIAQVTGQPVLTYNQSAAVTYFLVTLPEGGENCMAVLEKQLFAVHKEIQDTHGKRSFFSMGTAVKDVCSIAESTANAKAAGSLCTNTVPVKRYSSNTSASKQALFLPNQSIRKIKTFIISSLEKEIDSFFVKLTEEYSVLQEGESGVGANIYFTLRNAVLEVCGQYAPELVQEADDDLIFTGQLSKDFSSLRVFAQSTAKRIQEKRDVQSASLGKKVVQYIAENYSNPNLYASMLAEQFSISEKYVFSLVRAETGKSLGEYMEQVRFQHVEELLTAKESIHGIALQVGFNSVNTFYKAFKRVYGTSPAKWRDSQMRDTE